MTSPTITCLLTCLLYPGSVQVAVSQYKQVSVAEGGTAVLGCLLHGGDMQDFGIQWLKQLPSAPPVFLLYHGNDSRVHRADISPGRYRPIRSSSHRHYLHITNVTAQDSAVYWCVLTRNASYPIWGDGTLLSVYGGKDVRAPVVSLLSSPHSADDSAPFFAACLATGFYPPVIEVLWKLKDAPLSGSVVSGPFLEDAGSNVYSVLSILELPSQSRGSLSAVSCEVRHDSSRTIKHLHHC